MASVVLDLRMAEGRLHGIARYALELATRLAPLAPDIRWVGLTGPSGLPSDLGPLTPSIELHRCPAGFLSPFEQVALPFSLQKIGCDLFHATSFSLPRLWRGPLVATLHDANHLAMPEEYGPLHPLYYRGIVGPVARRARVVITVSSFSRDELSRRLALNGQRIQVIPLAAADRFGQSTPNETAALRKRLALPERFFLAVGNEKRFKNLELIARIAPKLAQPVVLLAGSQAKTRYRFPDSTIALTSVAEADLPALYTAARVVLVPSRYEGFGLPVLEAMASGVPVVAASGSSMDEVGADAVSLVSPDDEAGWLAEANRLASDEAVRAERTYAGLQRAKTYSWDVCAQAHLEIYRNALKKN